MGWAAQPAQAGGAAAEPWRSALRLHHRGLAGRRDPPRRRRPGQGRLEGTHALLRPAAGVLGIKLLGCSNCAVCVCVRVAISDLFVLHLHVQHETLPGKFAGSLTAAVEPHSCKLFVLTPVPR